MNASDQFLLALVVILAVPFLVWRASGIDRWTPLVVVQILAGILLGPGVLGAAFPAVHAAVFTPAAIAALNGVAWWAVMLFVWIAGIELDLSQAWRQRRDTLTTALLALAVPMALGAGTAALLVATPGWVGASGRPWQAVLGIGMACAVTALPILVLLMEKMAVLRTPFGQRVLRYASLDDILIWGVLALILVDWSRVGRQAAFLAGFVLAAWAMRAAMRRMAERDRWAAGLIWLAATGFAADWSGLHFMVGAFLAGAVIDAGWFDRTRMDLFRDHVLMALMPVFFLSTGLRTNWTMGGASVIGAAALLLAASVGGKLAGTHIAARLLGWRRGEASAIGLLLQTKALIMIIFAGILLDKAIITGATFTALLLMALASTVLTVPFAAPRLARLMDDSAG